MPGSASAIVHDAFYVPYMMWAIASAVAVDGATRRTTRRQELTVNSSVWRCCACQVCASQNRESQVCASQIRESQNRKR